MTPTADQGRLFRAEAADGTVFVNDRCRLQTHDGYRLAVVSGIGVAHYGLGDHMGEAAAMVSLVDQGWAKQTEVARAFGCSERTVRRHQRRFEQGGLQALGRPSGYPKGRARLPPARIDVVNLWKEKGESNREIARRLGVSEKAVRKLLRRLGWKPQEPEQISLDFAATDPGSSQPPPQDPGADAAQRPDADPNLSGSSQRLAEATTAEEAFEAVRGSEGSLATAAVRLRHR